MTKILLFSTALLLAVAGSQQYLGQNQQPQTTHAGHAETSSWNSYSPPKYDFSIKYPNDFSLESGPKRGDICFEETRVACVFYSGKAYTGTNLRGAGVSINIAPSLDSQAKCYNFENLSFEMEGAVADVTINGVSFKSATGGEGSMGRSDEVRIYRNFHNNRCYELEQRVASGNIANYDPGTIKKFNRDRIWRELQDIVGTFSFTK